MNIRFEAQATPANSADRAQQAKLADAAQQFEAMMLQELLKPMRTSEDDLSGEKSEDGSFDTIAGFGTESVAKSIAAHGGLGIAKMVLQRLSGDSEENQNNFSDSTKVSRNLSDNS